MLPALLFYPNVHKSIHTFIYKLNKNENYLNYAPNFYARFL